jgi:hypothetical protein
MISIKFWKIYLLSCLNIPTAGTQFLGFEQATNISFQFLAYRSLLLYSFIQPFIYSSVDLQPFIGPWPLHQFRNYYYYYYSCARGGRTCCAVAPASLGC